MSDPPLKRAKYSIKRLGSATQVGARLPDGQHARSSYSIEEAISIGQLGDRVGRPSEAHSLSSSSAATLSPSYSSSSSSSAATPSPSSSSSSSSSAATPSPSSSSSSSSSAAAPSSATSSPSSPFVHVGSVGQVRHLGDLFYGAAASPNTEYSVNKVGHADQVGDVVTNDDEKKALPVVRVGTWNVKHKSSSSLQNRHSDFVMSARKHIGEHFDVIGLVEVTTSKPIEELVLQLRPNQGWKAIYNNGPHHMILYNSKTTTLLQKLDLPESKLFTHGLLGAVFVSELFPFTLVVVHLRQSDPTSELISLKKLYVSLSSEYPNVVIVGDFNTLPGMFPESLRPLLHEGTASSTTTENLWINIVVGSEETSAYACKSFDPLHQALVLPRVTHHSDHTAAHAHFISDRPMSKCSDAVKLKLLQLLREKSLEDQYGRIFPAS